MTQFMPIGIYGGMFDPIHMGHLRIALEAQEFFHLHHVRFIPCHKPMHRNHAAATPGQRLAMIESAIKHVPSLRIDKRELDRDEPSYTYLTLQSLVADFADHALCLLVGIDAFLFFDQWYQWQKIIDYTHIIIVERPPFFSDCIYKHAVLGKFIEKHLTNNIKDLQATKAGYVFLFRPTQLEISSTQLRQKIAKKLSVDFLLPYSVIDYIKANKIYKN